MVNKGENSSVPVTASPLRYPGGKSRLAKYFSHLLRANGLTDCTYVEPFAGGAGAAIDLLRKEYVRTVWLNDVDPAIHALWHSVLNSTEALCDLIRDTPISVEEWLRQRAVLENSDASFLERGFATLYLNRTNRSGIIRGGLIGGIRQDGKWRLDARFNREGLIVKIARIASYRDRLTIQRDDALVFLQLTVLPSRKRMFVYLDPPYYGKGQDLYHNHYTHDDHIALAAFVQTHMSHVPWVVSYDDHPKIRNAYGDCRQLEYGINYSAADRYRGGEVLFFSPAISHPLLIDPLRVSKHARACNVT